MDVMYDFIVKRKSYKRKKWFNIFVEFFLCVVRVISYVLENILMIFFCLFFLIKVILYKKGLYLYIFLRYILFVLWFDVYFVVLFLLILIFSLFMYEDIKV